MKLNYFLFYQITKITAVIFLLLMIGCNTTKHLKEGEYLLRENTIQLESNKGITRQGELKEQLSSLIVQKNNTYTLFGWGPSYKLWLYNIRYEKYRKDTANYQLKTKFVEPPVIFDSSLIEKTKKNFSNYLFNSGYFHPEIKDTFILDTPNKKAKVTYFVKTGENYLIEDVHLDIDDSLVKKMVAESMEKTLLKKGTDFSMGLVDDERSRIVNYLKNKGLFLFSQDNVVNVSLDTVSEVFLKEGYNPFEKIINTLALQEEEKKNPTLDIKITIRKAEEKDAYKKHYLNRIQIYPDFVSREDVRDSTMINKQVEEVRLRYHNYYVKAKAIKRNINFEKGALYTQKNYDRTINKMNELGVFQSVRIYQFEDTAIATPDSGFVNTYILLSPAKKYDFSTNFEISRGTTYDVGSALSFTFRDKNFAKGANLLNISLRGGIETNYDQFSGENFFDNFKLFTRSAGINASLNFPKFIAPVSDNAFNDKPLPRTILSLGTNVLERVAYFTATNTTASFGYNWKETQNRTWDFNPAFINIFRLPYISDSFNRRLESVDFLKNLYTPVFIEGENLSFTYSNQIEQQGKSYTYLKLSLEEAGAVMNLINKISSFNINYAQYGKFDFDLRRYINRPHSQLATRFYGGVGLPYGGAQSLPYIKQYFAGGPYSIRGWRIRTLGPGSYVDTFGSNEFIDRTGDIKLELNSEYRFDIIQLFYGVIQLKGAVFADAGNIWLARKTDDYPNGEFRFDKFGRDLAISTGVGLRFDVAGFFIFRLDSAFPVKKPSVTDAGWNVNNIDLGNSQWRKDNVVLNIAIGYPF